jgi:hypothetical protein
MFVHFAKVLLWSKSLNDFKKQLAEVEEAKGMELIRPTLILPPMLNNGEKTNSYLSGEASAMKNAMSAINFVNRAGKSESRIGVWCNPNPLLPKTRSTSGPLACLILPACLFFTAQRGTGWEHSPRADGRHE